MAGESEKLLRETNKWLKKLEEEVKSIEFTDKMEMRLIKNAIDNVNAYISDCKHFLSKGDLVNAYEAIIYAWGIYETCQRMGLVKARRGL